MENSYNQGVTLIELIAVIVIVSVLALVAGPRFYDSGAGVQSSRDDFVAALFYAQQVAMARDSAANPITFTINSNTTISVNENGTPLTGGGATYPLTLANGVTLSTSSLTRNYDKLGRTTAVSVTLSGGGTSAIVTLAASGYAY